MCGPVTNTLEEMASTSNWGVDGPLMGGIILKFARIGHWPLHPSKSNTASPYKLHSSTQLILFTFISSTQSLSQKISNCFVLSTEKGNTYQPKSCYSMWQWSIFLRDLQLPYSVSCFVSFTKLNGWSPKFSQRFLNMFLRLSASASAMLG